MAPWTTTGKKRKIDCHSFGALRRDRRENIMSYRNLIAAIALAMLLPQIAQAAEDTKYPDFSGQWSRLATPGLPGQPSFDHTKPWGLGQQIPLTPEYQAIFEASLADQA